MLYFAYGANLNTENMEIRCPNATLIGTGMLDNFAFLCTTKGVASIEPFHGSVVYGAIWELTQEDEAFLDLFEGVKGGWYTKEYLMVSQEFTRRECLVYIASNNTKGKGVRDYLETIIADAQSYGFPEEYLTTIQCFL